MKLKLVLVGKTDEDFLQEAIEKYTSRLAHYTSFQMQVVALKKGGASLPASMQKQAEGKVILDVLQHDDYVVLLDEAGKQFSSIDFATHLQKKLNVINTTLVFIVGGAFGFSNEVYSRAQEKISLSQMTFSHQMIRLLFVEQLYRAFTILKGEKYHHS